MSAAAYRFVAAAFLAARTNASWTPLRAAADQLRAALEAHRARLIEHLPLEPSTGLPTYAFWARLRADQDLARDELHADDLAALTARAATSPTHATRLARRRYHDALRASGPVRLHTVDIAQRAALPRAGRSVLAVLDKVELDGVLVRISAELSLHKAVGDQVIGEVLFEHSKSEVDHTAAALRRLAGVGAVERVTRGAVDACAVVGEGSTATPLAVIAGRAGAAACSFSFATCSADVTEGDNDLFSDSAHRPGVYRDRKLVVSAAAQEPLAALARARGKRTMIYRVADQGAA